jgi:hypothetical protein
MLPSLLLGTFYPIRGLEIIFKTKIDFKGLVLLIFLLLPGCSHYPLAARSEILLMIAFRSGALCFAKSILTLTIFWN